MFTLRQSLMSVKYHLEELDKLFQELEESEFAELEENYHISISTNLHYYITSSKTITDKIKVKIIETL